MIYEYAIDPELACTWTDRISCAHIKSQFGINRGRLVSRYPKRWKKLVWEAYQRYRKKKTETQENLRKIQEEEFYLTEILQRLGDVFIKRSGYLWCSSNEEWLANAIDEHHRKEFRTIIAKKTVKEEPGVITFEDTFDEHPRWSINTAFTVRRAPEAMAELVAPMLRCCKEIIFVDKFFNADSARRYMPLKKFLQELVDPKSVVPTKRVEVHCAANDIDYEYFKKNVMKSCHP